MKKEVNERDSSESQQRGERDAESREKKIENGLELKRSWWWWLVRKRNFRDTFLRYNHNSSFQIASRF